jgi:uncharacterized protein YPO0396
MYSLFSTKPNESGFRLHTYEVWNWGTFDRDVWKIEPGGETSLLTGANASGKTTLIDGLLTLLVPEKRMRFYNQTAGSKGERTEESYLLGEYGETENQETQTREVKKLRPDKATAQSVLLAVFQNESQFITLAQARWFSGSELKRIFVLSHKKLSISDDFSPFDSAGDWRKKLKQKYPKQGAKEVVFLIDSPGEYGRLMRKQLGMKTEKAHTLFSQTIGLKVLGNLDEFVRLQMLEEKDSESEFQKIKDHFKTLNDAHKAIEKAHQQIEILNPIRDKSVKITEYTSELLSLESNQSDVPIWFASRQSQLIRDYLDIKESEKKQIEATSFNLDQEVSDLDGKRIKLEVQIETDEVGRQMGDLEKENKRLDREKNDRETELKHYNELARELEYQESPSSSSVFEDQRAAAIDKKKKAVELYNKNDRERLEAYALKQSLDKEFTLLTNQLSALRSQKNNITGRVADIRKEILEHTGATEKEIPFIGELIKVKEDSKYWEPAIESLLHGLAIRLIVSDEYYQKVSRYVNENDLKGRIVYHRFNKKDVAPLIFHESNEKELSAKLESKASPYKEWVESEIKTKYNYICTDDLEEFKLCDKAITSRGLLKNKSRHEKDDRPEIKSRQQYVLGWDTKEKIAALREKSESLDKSIRQADVALRSLQNSQARIKKEEETLTQFIEFNAFKKIDWWSLVTTIKTNQNKIEELQKTNNRVKTLKNQRDEIIESLKLKNSEVNEIKTSLININTDINQRRQTLREAEDVLAKFDISGIEAKLSEFESQWIADMSIDIENVLKLQRQISTDISEKLDKIKDKIRDEKSKAEKLMREFKNPDAHIINKFEDWKSDTHRLSESADFISEYVTLLDRIQSQELAEFKQQFKKYLNEEMITKMSDFQSWLQQQEQDIQDNIEILNISLEKINFKNNPPTFIKLHIEKDYTLKVKEFKIKLNDWKPNLAEFQRTQDDSILEASFVKIKSLLDQLTDDENMRKEVLDVRNWLKFKAVEHHREDPGKIFRSYTGTAKLSGGEGAQLTYTILGSAIAYQFGIHSEGMNTNSFRFICVDEAFSKQDDEKAQFLMELCKQLHLQLMVVSPAKAEEVAIVEPYIARVHFVQRKDNRNSVVYDMPIKQLQEKRESYLNT